MDFWDRKPLQRIAVIGDHLPRQCGIATFTSHLSDALAAAGASCFVLAVNDSEDGYAYPSRVRYEFPENKLPAYRSAADFLNLNNADLVCLQHEYGIYGGPAGSFILTLLRELRMPAVTTLHTVLREPDRQQRQVMEELAHQSERLVVMARRASEFLQEIYRVPAGRIDLIPHGIPDVPFVDSNYHKDKIGAQGKVVLLTFGLLSPDKGIENVINALPAILARHPNVVYLVVGATHPHVRLHDGESYRLSLERLVQERDVEQNVTFHNRFISLEELLEFIGAADIYLTPYHNAEQIVSGTLAYTVGAGKAVISTPYWYARELLAEGRGLLVPFGDPEAIAASVIGLLVNEAEFHAMRKRAYLFGREMIWPEVARRYRGSFEQARSGRSFYPQAAWIGKTRERGLPVLNLDHLRHMTDDTGLLQHAVFTVPNYNEGYTTDDNARALVLITLLEESGGEAPAQARELASRYLAFLWHAITPHAADPRQGRFRNFLGYDRRWVEEAGSEDSHGRALWGLGTVLGRSNDQELRAVADRLFNLALPVTLEFTSPRAWAFTLLGIHEYLRRFSGDRSVLRAREILAGKLMKLYHRTSSSDWCWFEDILAYNNATLPHALLLCGRWMARPDMSEAGLHALEWLAAIQRSEEGHFVPIGSPGYYRRGQERARFDQQPIEAHATILACLEAYRMTSGTRWRQEAQCAFDWFLGHNDLGCSLYDPATGGCCDGLHPDRVNQNQGAESMLAFLLSLQEMHMLERSLSPVE